MSKLILAVGFPRSGKTTKCKALAADLGAAIVNPDSIRLAIHGQAYIQEAEPYVWTVAKTMVKALFLAGHDTVIIDAVNNTVRRRNEWISKAWHREFLVIDTDADECIRRAIEEENDAIIPIIERMRTQHEPVSYDELKAWEH